ncbi:hypothetical protein [Desulfurobacterium indicum]|uniref:DUF4394 domain-containing protein n=1 Tax=Desulfurobacterium indicum TaxID=1914305 RepID=A0A1R1MKD8_9BACT|nr:hypothetical protein [Desulfurobacterium indicum]OMH40275.1 hypothetical protein BLW93_06205 [Desulfurobacterium indicum]
MKISKIPTKWKGLLTVVLFAALTAGCGGGGGTAPETGETPPETIKTNFYLPFVSTDSNGTLSLYIVNATDTTDVKLISNNITESSVLGKVSFSSANMTYYNFQKKFAVYIKDGKLFKTDLTTGETVQVSALTDSVYIADTIIAINDEPGYVEVKNENYTSSYIVPLNLSSSESPSQEPGEFITEIRDFNSNGKIEGLLILNGTTIEKCSLGETGIDACSPISSGIYDTDKIGTDFSTGNIYFLLDTDNDTKYEEVAVFYPSNSTMKTIYTTTSDEISDAELIGDSIYVNQFSVTTYGSIPYGDIEIGKISTAGSYTTIYTTAVTGLTLAPSVEFSSNGFVAIPSRVGFLITNGTANYTVASGPAYSSLFYSNNLYFANATGVYVWNLTTNSTTYLGKQPAGRTFKTSAKLENDPNLEMESISVYDNTTGELKFIDPETTTVKHTVNVDPSEVQNFLFYGVGKKFLAEVAVNSTNSTEVFLINLDDNKAYQVTNTTNATEYPLF